MSTIQEAGAAFKAHLQGQYVSSQWLLEVETCFDWSEEEDVIKVVVDKKQVPMEVFNHHNREFDGYKVKIDFITVDDEVPEPEPVDEVDDQEPSEEEIMESYFSNEIVDDSQDQWVLGHVKAIYEFFDSFGARIEEEASPQEKDDDDDDEEDDSNPNNLPVPTGGGAVVPFGNGFAGLKCDEIFRAKRSKVKDVLSRFSNQRREVIEEKIAARIETLKLSLNGSIDVRYCVDELYALSDFLDDPEIKDRTAAAVANIELHNS